MTGGGHSQVAIGFTTVRAFANDAQDELVLEDIGASDLLLGRAVGFVWRTLTAILWRQGSELSGPSPEITKPLVLMSAISITPLNALENGMMTEGMSDFRESRSFHHGQRRLPVSR